MALGQSRSFSAEAQRSFLETRSRVETAQYDLVSYLKWLVVLIGVILFFIFLKFMLTPGCNTGACTASKSYSARVRDTVTSWLSSESDRSRETRDRVTDSQQKERAVEVHPKRAASQSGEGFWAGWFPKWGCQGWNDLKDKLAGLRYAVKSHLPELPSLEAIRSHPGRFNVSLPEMSTTRTEVLTKVHPPEQVFASLNSIIDLGGVTPDSSMPQLEQAKAAVAREHEKTSSLERALEDEPMADLRVKLSDAAGSQRAFLNKRAQLSDLRTKLFNAYKSLKECELKENETLDKIERDKADQAQLTARLRDLDNEEAGLKSRINEKEKTLSEAHRKNRDRIMELNNRETDLKNILNRRADFEREIQDRRNKVKRLRDEQETHRLKISDDDRRAKNLQAQLDELESRRRLLNTEIKALARKQQIFSMRLSTMQSQRDLKNCLVSMIQDKNKDKCFGSLKDAPAVDDKEMAQIMDKYEREINEADLPNDVDKQEWARAMEKDREEILDLIKKYREWQRIIDQYKGTNAEISQYQDRLREIEDTLRRKKIELDEMDKKKRDLEAELRLIDEASKGTRNKIKSLEEEAVAHEDWIARKTSELANISEAWDKLRQDKQYYESEYQTYQASIASNFGDVDRQQNELREKKGLIKMSLDEIQPRVRLLTEQLERSRGDCASLKAFYVKTAEMVPSLKAALDNDRAQLAQLKADIAKFVDPFYTA